MTDCFQIAIAGITVEAKINKDEIEFYKDIYKELNTECNNIIARIGNIDKTILLFYLFFKTEEKLLKNTKKNDIKNYSASEIFFKILTLINKNIEEKNNDKTPLNEQVTNIRKKLILMNMLERSKLKKIEQKTTLFNKIQEDDEYDFIKIINSFTDDIKQDINILNNGIELL